MRIRFTHYKKKNTPLYNLILFKENRHESNQDRFAVQNQRRVSRNDQVIILKKNFCYLKLIKVN
jgi:hypothetical protein